MLDLAIFFSNIHQAVTAGSAASTFRPRGPSRAAECIPVALPGHRFRLRRLGCDSLLSQNINESTTTVNSTCTLPLLYQASGRTNTYIIHTGKTLANHDNARSPDM